MRNKLSLICLLLPLIALAEGGGEQPKVYRWVDKDGSVHFSATPPPSGEKSTEIELRQPDAVIHQENRVQMLNQGDRVGKQVDARQELRARVMQQIDAAKEALAKANEAQISGEAPRPGETQHVVGGATRLTDAYHKRRAAEAKQIEHLQQQIEALYGELNKLR